TKHQGSSKGSTGLMERSLMPQVAFHFNAPDKLDYACRFIRKAMRHDARVTVVAPLERLRQLSARLWKFGGHEFLAHAVQGDDAELFALAPVVLVEAVQVSPYQDVLLNLGIEMPQGFEDFSKVVEV
ncbi:DNA polymerase III subunit chi, partial [Pseudomonas aeruginosa]